MAKRKERTVEDLGTFQLTSLLMRRARELMSGSPALVETGSSDPEQHLRSMRVESLAINTDEAVTKD